MEGTLSKPQTLVEVISAPEVTLLTEKELGRKPRHLHFVTEIQRADTRNRNGRVYPRSVLEREVERFQQKIKERTSFGEADHPQGTPSVRASAVLWEKVWMEPGGRVMGQAKVMETGAGKDVRAILEAGGQIGTSSRGTGSLVAGDFDGNEAEVVGEDYALSTFDVVINQSVETAVPEKTFVEQTGDKSMFKTLEEMQEQAPELYQKLMEAALKEAETGFAQTVQQILDEKREEMREELKAELEESGATTDPKLTEQAQVYEACLQSIVAVLREARVLDESPEVKDEEVRARIEALEQQVSTLQEEKEELQQALAEAASKVEQSEVAESIREKAQGHPLEEALVANLLESCPTQEALDARFDTIKARYDTLAENVPGPKPTGKSQPSKATGEKAPIVEQGEKKGPETGKDLTEQEHGLRALAGIRG